MSTILFIATVAAGGGDIAFAARMLSYLISRGYVIHLAVSAQSGTKPVAVLQRILDTLLNLANDISQIHYVSAGCRSVDSVSLELAWVPTATITSCESHSMKNITEKSGLMRPLVDADSVTARETQLSNKISASDTKSGAHLVNCVVQGPLRCFNTSHEALRCLYDSCAPILAEIPLLTIREFGQATFCSTSNSAKRVVRSIADDEIRVSDYSKDGDFHFDVSAGFDIGEIGIFCEGAQKEHCARTHESGVIKDEEKQMSVVCYTRTASHARNLACMLGQTLLKSFVSEPVPGGETATSDTITATNNAQCDIFVLEMEETMPRLLEGLSTPLKAVGLSINQTSANSWVISHETSHHSDTSPRWSINAHAINSFTMPQHEFERTLARSQLALVSGDASLNESIIVGCTFLYSPEPHKHNVATALYRLAMENGCSEAVARLMSGTGTSDVLIVDAIEYTAAVRRVRDVIMADWRLEDWVDSVLPRLLKV